MVCVLGGRAAEQVVVGAVSSGAANDLQVVNQIARRAVEEFGFSPRAGQIIAAAHGQALPLADQTRSIIDEEVERIVADAYRDALALLAEHREALDRLATALLERKELDRLDITLALEGLEPGRRRFVHGHAMGPTGRRALRALPGREEPAAVARYEQPGDEGLLVDAARWLRSRRRRPARRSGLAAFARRRDSDL
jgi:hypothetical protein